MSAFMVGADHIDALLTFALAEPRNRVCYYVNDTRVEITPDNADEVGRILLTENERSIRHRYPDASDDDGLGDAQAYTFRPWSGILPAVAVLKGCDCFDYQACETDDYRASLAWTIIDAIRHRAIMRLPGWDNAPGWEFRRPDTAPETTTFARSAAPDKKPPAPSLKAVPTSKPAKPADDTGITF